MKKRLIAVAFAGAAAAGALAVSVFPAHGKAVEILPPGVVDVKHAGVHVLPAPAPANNGGKAKI